jgi:hypothetical protein
MQERLCKENGTLTSQLLEASHKIATYAAKIDNLDKVWHLKSRAALRHVWRWSSLCGSTWNYVQLRRAPQNGRTTMAARDKLQLEVNRYRKSVSLFRLESENYKALLAVCTCGCVLNLTAQQLVMDRSTFCFVSADSAAQGEPNQSARTLRAMSGRPTSLTSRQTSRSSCGSAWPSCKKW